MLRSLKEDRLHSNKNTREDNVSYHHDHAIPHIHSHGEEHRREYRTYCCLFIVSFIGASMEFLIALLLARSVSAQADAIHAFTHLALYGLSLWISRQIFIRRMNRHDAYHYREQFLIFYVLLVFTGLVWICYTSITKLFSYEAVVSSYMLMSVTAGLLSNIIALGILRSLSKMHGNATSEHRTHQWLSLDTWWDFMFSVIVLATALLGIGFPSLPIHMIDPILSLGAVIWMAYSGIQILRKKHV